MKKHLRAMLEALIEGDSDKATEELHTYLSSKTRVVLGEKEEEDDDDKEEKKDDEKEDKDDDKDDDDDDDDDDDVKEEGLEHIKGSVDHTPVHQGGAESKEGEYKSYRHNEKGEAYRKVPHKDNSEGYGHEKSKAKSKAGLKDIPGGKESGAKSKKGDAYTSVPHKDNSEGYGYEKTKAKSNKGIDKVSEKATKTASPHQDGKKENRRTDKAKGYHGKSREGKDLG